MITIQSGKLVIPENERFVGFAGDNTSEEKQFVIKNHVASGVYTLNLRFDDGAVCSVVLPSRQADGDTALTWNILREHLKSPGIVTAQLKMTDGSGNITHTTRDYFLVGYSTEQDESPDDEPTDLSLLEERIEEIENTLPFVSVAGAFIKVNGSDVRIARYSEVYNKSEIDGMIGGIEAQLAAV